MAKRIIQSPGVEIRENDLSLRLPTPAGTTVYVTGFSDQGPTDEVVGVSSLTEFEQIYGVPKNAAERYFYHTVRSTLNSQAKLLVNRLPYGTAQGSGFGSSISVLAYPGRVVTNNNTIGTNFNVVSGTYLLGRPTQFNITPDQYLKLAGGTLFNWSSGAATTFSSLADLSGAALIIVNKAQTTIDSNFNGYYIGLADNTNINPASSYNAINSVQTVTQSAGATGLPGSSFVQIPTSRFDFSLTATAAFGNNPATNSVSQIMEDRIVGYNLATRDYDDTLNVGVFKLRQSVFSNDANKLDSVIEEGYNGSIGYYRRTTSEAGGQPINFFLENVENDSRNIDMLVNPYISDFFSGERLNSNGTPQKKIRVISQQLSSGLTDGTTPVSIAGVDLATFATVAGTLNYADALFPLGAYGAIKLDQKSIGNIPDKLTRALERIRNTEVYNIDIIAEGGLGTIYTYTNTSGNDYFDDTRTTPAIEALRTSNDLTTTTARDAYNTIFTKFVTFAGPIKDGGRGDIIFVADPLRQILVQGKDNKIINDSSRNFSVDIYWALRHQYELANTSYACVYANYFKVFDEYSSLYIYVPASGYVAAKLVSTDADIGPWGAPAGFNRGVVTDALDIAFAPNQRQRDDLYNISLNPIAAFPDQGLVLFGQKTLLKKPSAFDRINVRRNFLYLEKATQSVMKFFLFENNTLFTRTRVINTLSPFFERVKAADGLYDYLIVCDDRNNTAEVIDNNELVVDIYLKPVRTAEFIQVNFYATRTDANFQELVGG